MKQKKFESCWHRSSGVRPPSLIFQLYTTYWFCNIQSVIYSHCLSFPLCKMGDNTNLIGLS